MKRKILDEEELDLKDIKNILRKRGKEINVSKVIVKETFIRVEQSDVVKVRIKINHGKIKISPGLPSFGNIVQMVSSLVFIIILFFINFPFFIFFAIVCGQAFSLLYYYPKAQQLKKDILRLINIKGK